MKKYTDWYNLHSVYIAITNDFINFQQFQQLMDFSEIVENTHFLQYVGARWSLVRYEPSGKLTF